MIGYAPGMTESNKSSPLDDVMVPSETAHPDHREHAKTPHRLDDDELARRAQQEREEVATDRDPD